MIIALVGAMKEVNITPVVEDPSASGKLAWFASMNKEQILLGAQRQTTTSLRDTQFSWLIIFQFLYIYLYEKIDLHPALSIIVEFTH